MADRPGLAQNGLTWYGYLAHSSAAKLTQHCQDMEGRRTHSYQHYGTTLHNIIDSDNSTINQNIYTCTVNTWKFIRSIFYNTTSLQRKSPHWLPSQALILNSNFLTMQKVEPYMCPGLGLPLRTRGIIYVCVCFRVPRGCSDHFTHARPPGKLANHLSEWYGV